MKYKWKFIFVLGIFCMLLTSCGAAVHTETSFERDGSGERIVFLNIADKDESGIKGGFDKVLSVLKEKAPEGVTVQKVHNDKKSQTTFRIKYQFDSIEEYKKQTKKLTGKDSDILWEREQEPFRERISYKETITTSDLIQWVVDAVKKQYKIYAFFDDSLLTEEENTVWLNGEEVWKGNNNPEFEKEYSPKLEKVSVYTTYTMENKVSRKISLGFAYDDYKTMNLEKGLNCLKEYSKKFETDSTCNGYSVTLNGQKEMKSFLSKAGDVFSESVPWDEIDTRQPEKESYLIKKNIESSVFSDYFSATEVYNLNKLLSIFTVSADYIENYLSVPDSIAYSTSLVHLPFAQEKTERYQYIGKYPVGDTYYMKFTGEDSVKMKSASVSYQLDGEKNVSRKITLSYQANGREVTQAQLSEFFKERGEWLNYDELEDGAVITVVKEYKQAVSDGFYKNGNVYHFDEKFVMSDYYIPEGIKVKYQISLPANFKLKKAVINGKRLSKADRKSNSESRRWIYEIEQNDNQDFSIKVDYRYKNHMLLLFILLFLCAGTGIGVTIYTVIRRYKKESENLQTKEE